MSLCEKDHEIVKMLVGNKKKSYVIVMADNKQNSLILHITVFPGLKCKDRTGQDRSI